MVVIMTSVAETAVMLAKTVVAVEATAIEEQTPQTTILLLQIAL